MTATLHAIITALRLSILFIPHYAFCCQRHAQKNNQAYDPCSHILPPMFHVLPFAKMIFILNL